MTTTFGKYLQQQRANRVSRTAELWQSGSKLSELVEMSGIHPKTLTRYVLERLYAEQYDYEEAMKLYRAKRDEWA